MTALSLPYVSKKIVSYLCLDFNLRCRLAMHLFPGNINLFCLKWHENKKEYSSFIMTTEITRNIWNFIIRKVSSIKGKHISVYKSFKHLENAQVINPSSFGLWFESHVIAIAVFKKLELFCLEIDTQERINIWSCPMYGILIKI